jgi:hypothetical protein
LVVVAAARTVRAGQLPCYYRSLLMLLPRAARTTANSKGLSDVAGQSCPAGAGSSALHPPHDQLWPTAAFTLGLGGAIYGRVAGSMLGGGGCCPGGREPGLRRSVGISRMCTYSTLYTQSFWKYARFRRRHPPSPCSLQESIHPPIHPLSVSARGGAYPPRRGRGVLHVEGPHTRHAPKIIGDCGLGSRVCFSPTAVG